MNQAHLELQHRNKSSTDSPDTTALTFFETVASSVPRWKWRSQLEAASSNPDCSKREASSRHLDQWVGAAHKVPAVLKSALRPAGHVSTSRRSLRVSLAADIESVLIIPRRECHDVAQATETVRMGMLMRMNRDESVAIDFDEVFESYESDANSFAVEEDTSAWFSELRKARPSRRESDATPDISPLNPHASGIYCLQKQQGVATPKSLPTIIEERTSNRA